MSFVIVSCLSLQMNAMEGEKEKQLVCSIIERKLQQVWLNSDMRQYLLSLENNARDSQIRRKKENYFYLNKYDKVHEYSDGMLVLFNQLAEEDPLVIYLTTDANVIVVNRITERVIYRSQDVAGAAFVGPQRTIDLIYYNGAVRSIDRNGNEIEN